jgi:hypothetical protein
VHDCAGPMATDNPPPNSEEGYINWFAWAKRELRCDREIAHAAAAMACCGEVNGDVDLSDVANLARLAAAGHTAISSRLKALAEWSYWADTELGATPLIASRCAHQAIAAIEAGADLSVAMAVARAAAETDLSAGTSEIARRRPSTGGDTNGGQSSDSVQGPSQQTSSLFVQRDAERQSGRNALPETPFVWHDPDGLRAVDMLPEPTPSLATPRRLPTNIWIWAIPLALLATFLAAFSLLIYGNSPRVEATVGPDGRVKLVVSSFPPMSKVYFHEKSLPIARW